MAVLVQLPRLPTNCPSRNSYINIQNGHLFKDPIGVFNPHTWPPNLEGVRGSPTATELITIDRQLFYDAMWRIWSFHPTIIRILSDSHYRDVVTPPDITHTALTSSWWGEARQDVRDLCEKWEVSSECYDYICCCLGGSWPLPRCGVALQVLSSSRHHPSHYGCPDQPGVVMSCWAVLTAPASSYHHQGARGRDISNHSRDPNLRLLK